MSMKNCYRCAFFLFWLSLAFARGQNTDSAVVGSVRTDTPPQLNGVGIQLSEFGADDAAYLTLPQQAPIGGVVMIHEWWGLNDYIRATADRLAREGYIVVAVDLYNGVVTNDPTRASELMRALEYPSALKTVTAAVNLLHQSPRFHCDRVAVLGWCMGGGVCLRAALEVKGLDAAVVYYGPLVLDEKELSKLHVPLLGIFGQQDQVVRPDDVHTFDTLLTKLDKPHEFHMFDAVHAFANPSNAKYNQEDADQAWKLSLDFLKRQLSAPPPKQNVLDKVFN